MQPPLHVGQVLTVFGPVLPPVMQWQRTFQKFLPAIFTAEIPQFVFKTALGSLLLSKCSWDFCYNGADDSFSLQPPRESSDPVTESFEFSAVPEVSTKRGQKPRSAKILVDTEVRRSVRLSVLREGFHRSPSRGSQQIKTQRSFKRRRTSSSQPEGNPTVPPPTPITDLQHIGARLRIAPEKISKDKLEADPCTSSSNKSSDD